MTYSDWKKRQSRPPTHQESIDTLIAAVEAVAVLQKEYCTPGGAHYLPSYAKKAKPSITIRADGNDIKYNFSKPAATQGGGSSCKKCGTFNEYVTDSNYICYSCRNC